MKIAIIGYGKMGKEIEAVAVERGHEVCAKLSSQDAGFGAEALNGADAAIEFTRPEYAVANIETCFEANVPVVVGTTGWYNAFDQVEANCKSNKGGLFTATNFSLGVNLFWKVNQYLAKIMNNYPEYAVDMEEIHHLQKLDAPSGTAITTAEKIIEELDHKSNWKLSENENGNGSENENENEGDLKIVAKRLPEVPGTHEVFYSSDIDTISIKHEAHNRKGFALGSVLAAEFMQNREGIYTMNDLLKF